MNEAKQKNLRTPFCELRATLLRGTQVQNLRENDKLFVS